ncbi:hypothetical protein [uncultured Gimesia sp.]|uniref:hypothetical protein n=1 Tax=uncultured Gimesia sp. TaxID=1678688 RepID=UPI0030DCC7FB|tara:strand:- start:45023 stop:45724 length:702 start_codon:yes stop_codon:yes gene_type:complete
MTNSPETEYVDRILDLNPLEQSTEILAQRHAFLHPQAHSAQIFDTHSDHFERREQAVQQIQSLRNVFWSLKQPMLLQQLEQIDVTEFPDLALGLSRLRMIAELKDSFQRLKQHHACFDEFYEPFCSLVVAPPGTADELRTTLLEASRRESADFDFVGPEDYDRAASIIQREFPELYQLETYWLNQIARTTKQGKSIRRTIKILYFLIASTLGITILLSLIYVFSAFDISFGSH